MDALIIMTRVPIPNKTKTRLMDIYTGVECCKLHRCFLKDIFKVCSKINHGLDIFLSFTPENAYNLMEELVPSFITSFPQQGRDLGEKMYNSINYLFNMNYEKVILIGSDIPEIKEENIKIALKNLDNSDVCLGATYDGGYYLIGMKKAHPELFNSKLSWGKKTVFENTVELAEHSGLKISYTFKCRDIDTKEDIREFLYSVNNEDFPVNSYYYFKNNWRKCFLGEI